MGDELTIADRLPDVIPTTPIRVNEEHTVEETSSGSIRTVYRLEKTPFEYLVEVTAIVDGIEQELTIGTDIEERDTTDTDGPDSVAFIGDKHPDVGTTFYVTYSTEPIIGRYIGTFDADLELVGVDIETNAIEGKSVETASVDELELIGSQFGELGRRRGRPVEEYRAVLRSIVNAATGNGTIPSMKFAIATAIGGDIDNIEIEEDFEQTGFTVTINESESAIEFSSLTDVIDLAQPSGVELLQSPFLPGEDAEIVFEAIPSEYEVVSEGLGSGELGDEEL